VLACFVPHIAVTYLIFHFSGESCHDDVINSQQRKKIQIEIGQAIDHDGLPEVFPAIYMLLVEQND